VDGEQRLGSILHGYSFLQFFGLDSVQMISELSRVVLLSTNAGSWRGCWNR
jgi:hypothetical protein